MGPSAEARQARGPSAAVKQAISLPPKTMQRERERKQEGKRESKSEKERT